MSTEISPDEVARAAQLLAAAKALDLQKQTRKEFEEEQEELVGQPGSRLVKLNFSDQGQTVKRVYFEIEEGKYADYSGLSTQREALLAEINSKISEMEVLRKKGKDTINPYEVETLQELCSAAETLAKRLRNLDSRILLLVPETNAVQ